MTGRTHIPGPRGLDASLDAPDGTDTTAGGATDACVVACPPHPQLGGRRTDARLRAVADHLGERGVACLRFDYGPWDEGYGERDDAHTALDWASERYDRLALFGYSFGGAVCLLAAAERDDLRAASALAPAARLSEGLDAAAALAAVTCPLQLVYGERDTTADWAPVVEAARDRAEAGAPVRLDAMGADHHFVGQHATVAATVGDHLLGRL